MTPRAVNIVSKSNADTDYISLTEAKTHLRISGTDDDTYVTALITAALQIASSYVGYSVVKAVAQYIYKGRTGSLSGYPTESADSILRLYAKVLSVTNVKYYDADGALQDADYETPNVLGAFGTNVYLNQLQSDNSGDNYLVNCVVGFEKPGATADVSNIFPNEIKWACYMIMANLYDNRQDLVIGANMTSMPMNSQYLLNPYKIQVII